MKNIEKIALEKYPEDFDLTNPDLPDFNKNKRDIFIQGYKECLKNIEDNPIDVQEFYSEILEIADHHILLNCLIDEKSKTNQIRKFDLLPFKNFDKLEIGGFIKIKTTTFTGKRIFEYIHIEEDLTHLFKQENIFESLKNTAMFNFDKNDK